ncbi:hypothetical protein D5086_029306 [Populus alba]|uniref:Uncharacterized protein n=1 Tax=Populus alba TaxID=43335 RepID=A0ACC4ATQ8_POPAL
MNIVSLQTRFRKKVPYATHLFQTLSQQRPFSSHKFRRTTQTKRLDKALRILDIITPKTTAPTNGQNHLRVIQDFLQAHSNRTGEQRLSNDFISPNSDNGDFSVFDEILESSFINNDEDSNATSLSFDASVLSNAVSSCASTRDLRGGIQYHCLAISTGFIANALHGSVWIGIQAAENTLLLEPECAATHMQLANLYASVGFWDQAARDVSLKCKRSVKLYTIMCVHKLPSSSVVRIMQNDPHVHLCYTLFVGAARRCQDKNLGSRWVASNGFCSGDTILSKTLKGENICFCSKRMELNLIVLNLRGVSYNSHFNSSIPIQHTKIRYGV